MKKLVKPNRYCDKNVEFYGSEGGVTPVTPPQPINPYPNGGGGGGGGNGNPGGSGGSGGQKFADVLAEIMNKAKK